MARIVTRSLLSTVALALVLCCAPPAVEAAGALTPVGAGHEPLRTQDHRVQVAIDNGFARTEVHQTFWNPADQDLEGIFRLPLPQHASLAEMTIFAGERELHGEVLAADEAERLYGEEKSKGNDAGLGSKDGHQSFEFRVWPVPAGGETTVRFVYYQPLEIDTGVGRYLYPLEEGGTDGADSAMAQSFWTLDETVDGSVTIEVDLQSAWPIADVRVPGFEAAAEITEVGQDRFAVRLDRPGAALDTDFVLYYRLEQDLPGRVELLTHRPDPSKPGTFMMVLTPALDLAPITGGSDYVFVLDVSGSMAAKLGTLARGVGRALGELDGEDRYRIVLFDDRARRLGPAWTEATPGNVAQTLSQLEALGPGGSTNLYEGLALGTKGLDEDRATSVVLVTDAETNTGIVSPREFQKLLEAHDVRIFGFLLGNSGNWPLMELIAETSGGFYAQVSNQDDILGQLLLAQEKVTHEALHDVELSIDGASGLRAFDLTGKAPTKIYRGQQLVVFGRYDGEGEAQVRLAARMTGEDKTYRTRFAFPDESHDHPELERLWALSRIEDVEALMRVGLLDPDEGKSAVEDLGVEYQIVTDETSMVVLADAAFEAHGVERRNRDRVALERDARARRAAQPIRRARVDDNDPMFGGRSAPSAGSGAGAFGLLEGLLVLLAGCALMVFGRRPHGAEIGGRRPWWL